MTEKLLPRLTGEDILADLALFCSGFAGCAAEFGATLFKSVYASCPYFSDEEDQVIAGLVAHGFGIAVVPYSGWT